MSLLREAFARALAIAATAPLCLAALPAHADDACVPPQSALIDVRVDGSVVSFCSADESAKACWQIDLAAAPPRWLTLPLRRVAGPPAEGAYERNTVSPDGSVVATWADGPMTFSEVATKQALFTIKPWKTAMGDPSFLQGVYFVGPAVAVTISSSPVSSAARLFDAKTGRAIGPVGPHGTDLDECPPLDLGGDRWAFATFMAGRVVIANVRTGKVVRVVEAAGGVPMTSAQRLAALPDGRILLVPYTPDIPLIVANPKGGRATRIAFPLCPAASPETPTPTVPPTP